MHALWGAARGVGMFTQALAMEPPKPIPESPTHCRGCGVLLPPLRRWGGKCRACVAAMHTPVSRAVDPHVFRWTEVKRFTRQRPGGIRERCVQARCQCGTERLMTIAEFEQRRSSACKRCIIKATNVRRVESGNGK